MAAACFIPKTITHSIDRLCANFFWQGADSSRHRHWISWQSIQKPQVEGGLGVRDLLQFQVCLAIKGLWSILHGSSLWSSYAWQRFIKDNFYDCTRPFPACMPLTVF